MSSELLRRTADVLEKVAEHLDAEENHRRETVQHERLQTARALTEKYASATGEELPPGTVEKLAASDADLLAIFEKIAARTDGAATGDPDNMGTPSDRSDRGAPTPTNSRYRDGQEKRAAAEDADQRLVDWCMS
jgi:hypothetical protein